jgi:hypothetical protein
MRRIYADKFYRLRDKRRLKQFTQAEIDALLGQLVCYGDGNIGTVISHNSGDRPEFTVRFEKGEERFPETRTRGMRESYLFTIEGDKENG